MARFVVVVDTQRDFMAADGALSVAGADALIGPMERWLRALDPVNTAGVLFTFDTHLPDVYEKSAEAKAFPIHCMRGTKGWTNVLDIASIDPLIPTWRIEKSVFDMWAEDGLIVENVRTEADQQVPRDAFFADIKAKGINDVTVIGVAADYCVRWAIAGLVERDFRVEVIEQLTRGIDRQLREIVADEFVRLPVVVTATV